MLLRRLPPDNFTDDTENSRYQNYHEQQARHWSLALPINIRKWLAYGGVGLVIVILGLASVFFYHQMTDDPLPTTTNAPLPTETPISLVMLGDFPPQVPQRFINIPARIDDVFAAGEARGYTFYAEAGVTWQITLTPDTALSARISLYGPNGQFILSDEGGFGEPASIVYVIDTEGLYAIHLEATNGSGGGYTYSMYPQGVR